MPNLLAGGSLMRKGEVGRNERVHLFRICSYYFCWRYENESNPHVVSVSKPKLNSAPLLCEGMFPEMRLSDPKWLETSLDQWAPSFDVACSSTTSSLQASIPRVVKCSMHLLANKCSIPGIQTEVWKFAAGFCGSGQSQNVCIQWYKLNVPDCSLSLSWRKSEHCGSWLLLTTVQWPFVQMSSHNPPRA